MMPTYSKPIRSQRFKNTFYLKYLILLLTSLTVVGCSTLGPISGSVKKRSSKLSSGLQKAYTIPKSTADRVSPIIIQSADQYGVKPITLAAMIHQESGYRSTLVSSSGAVGLTQVIPRFWQQKCPGDLFNERININCGSYILASYNQSSGSEKKALAYYNVGPTGYNSNRKMKRQGKRYARQVKQHEKTLKGAL